MQMRMIAQTYECAQLPNLCFCGCTRASQFAFLLTTNTKKEGKLNMLLCSK